MNLGAYNLDFCTTELVYNRNFLHYIEDTIYTYKTWILCVCPFICSLFPKPPKVPASWNVASMHHMADLKHDEVRLLNCTFLRILGRGRGVVSFFAYTNVHHYHFYSRFPKSPIVIISWNVVPSPTLGQLKREAIPIFKTKMGVFFFFFFISKFRNYVLFTIKHGFLRQCFYFSSFFSGFYENLSYFYT